jgi:O-antigen/teichoic acid export membrane protein
MRRQPASFGRNSLSVFVANVGTAGVLIAITVATARFLGTDGRGVYAVGVLLPALVFVLGSMGLPAATTYLAARNEYTDGAVMRVAIVESGVVGLLAAFVGAVVFFTVGHRVLGSLSLRDGFISIAAVPFLFVSATVQAFLLGKHRYAAYNIALFGQAAIILASVVAALTVFGGDATVAIAATTTGVAVGAVCLAVWCVRRLSGRLDRPPRAYLREMLRFGIQSHLSNVLTFLGYRFDVFLLAAYTTASTVGIYSAAVAIGERPWIFSAAASTVLFSRLSAERHEERRRELTPVVARSVFWLTALAAGVLVLISRPLVLLFYSDSFEPAITPLRAILIGIVFFSAGRILANDIAARGRPLLNSYLAGAAAAANIGLNVLLIPRYGATGAALASTISYTLLFAATAAWYCRLSGNGPVSILVPSVRDVRLWRDSLTGGLRSAIRRPDAPYRDATVGRQGG